MKNLLNIWTYRYGKMLCNFRVYTQIGITLRVVAIVALYRKIQLQSYLEIILEVQLQKSATVIMIKGSYL